MRFITGSIRVPICSSEGPLYVKGRIKCLNFGLCKSGLYDWGKYSLFNGFDIFQLNTYISASFIQNPIIKGLFTIYINAHQTGTNRFFFRLYFLVDLHQIYLESPCRYLGCKMVLCVIQWWKLVWRLRNGSNRLLLTKIRTTFNKVGFWITRRLVVSFSHFLWQVWNLVLILSWLVTINVASLIIGRAVVELLKPVSKLVFPDSDHFAYCILSKVFLFLMWKIVWGLIPSELVITLIAKTHMRFWIIFLSFLSF